MKILIRNDKRFLYIETINEKCFINFEKSLFNKKSIYPYTRPYDDLKVDWGTPLTNPLDLLYITSNITEETAPYIKMILEYLADGN